MGWFRQVVEYHRGGYATTGDTPSSFIFICFLLPLLFSPSPLHPPQLLERHAKARCKEGCCTLYTSHCTLYTVQNTLSNVQLQTVSCTLYTIQYTMYSEQFTSQCIVTATMTGVAEAATRNSDPAYSKIVLLCTSLYIYSVHSSVYGYSVHSTVCTDIMYIVQSIQI